VRNAELMSVWSGQRGQGSRFDSDIRLEEFALFHVRRFPAVNAGTKAIAIGRVGDRLARDTLRLEIRRRRAPTASTPALL